VWLCGVLALQIGAGCSFDSGGLRWYSNGTDCGVDPACQSNNNSNSNFNSNNNNNPGPEYCTNGVDDDGDGLVDCDDPQCAMAPTCLFEDCTNGLDDDGDGLADCDDPDCATAPSCVPESCANGVDDDLDGQVDCDDGDCLGTPECGDCHPISNDGCTTGNTCYLRPSEDWFGVCLPGDGTGRGQWGYCDEPTACGLGYYCSSQYYICLRVCHPGGNDCGSIPGTTCRDLGDAGSQSPWGACYW